MHDNIDDKLSEKHVNFIGISLPSIDNFENDIDLDGTSGKSWDLIEPGSVKSEADDYMAETYDN